MLLWDDIRKNRERLKMERIKRMVEEYRIKPSEAENNQGIPAEATKRHLANQSERFRKYQTFSTDQKFKEKCQRERMKCIALIGQVFNKTR